METKRSATLALAATGVVFGDIGTSPLYTMRECFAGLHPLAPSPGHVLGILSLVFWALLIVVTVKYVTFVMRADNRGEGGIMALMAMASRGVDGRPRLAFAVTMLGLAGAALFYGDGMITPAISVLSAVEGLEVAAPELQPFVLPLAVGVLVGLFLMQSRGTESVGILFGPIMVLWFLILGGLGVAEIARQPLVLAAVLPGFGLAFVESDPARAFLILGAVVLALTGAEALYADMGHFGKTPIRLAWFGLVLPALLLNYFGQGALLLSEPEAVANPFYHMAPDWALYPMVVLATVATVIASQAVISGAFSMTRQAIQLGYSPRLRVRQTSEHEIGQIYVPRVNWTLLAAVVGLVLGFRSSANLAGAYGIAVTGTMLATTVLVLIVARTHWHWSRLACAVVGGAFLAIDGLFFAANALKIPDGGWFPLASGAVVLLLMTTWKTGRELVNHRLSLNSLPLTTFVARCTAAPPLRVGGTAIYMARNPSFVPNALLHNLKHNKVLHERVVLVTVQAARIPRIGNESRCRVEHLESGFHRLFIRFGFMEDTDLPATLQHCADLGLDFDMMDTSFFISRETVIPTALPGMALWREHLFAAMARNAASATDFFKIPPERVVEVGTQVQV